MTYDDDTIDWSTVPPAKMFHLVMQELVDVRNELKQEFKEGIATLDQKLTGRIDRLTQEMVEMKKELKSDIHVLRLEVHQNQIAFMTNHNSLEKRVKVLEVVA